MSGCLLGIVQFPLIIALYRVLLLVFRNGNLDHISATVSKIAYFDFLKITQEHIDPWFFGFNLGIAPSAFQEHGYYYLILPVITGILQYYQVVASQPKSKEPEKKPEKKKNDKSDDSFQAVFQKQMKFMFPLMVGYFAYILPSGLSLYWNIFSIFSILQARQRNK